MTQVKHSERAHAVLSASGASRWMACTPSAMLEKDIPDTTSEYAAEGTAAHEYSEIYLKHEIGKISQLARTRRLNKFARENEYYSQSMDEYVQKYVDVVVEKINEAKARSEDAIVLLEQRLDFSRWVPKGFGTGDVVIISDGNIEVIDLKYGRGVPVSAENNPQLRLYGLGAFDQYDMLYEFDTVTMTIVQPRLDSISSETLKAEDLVKWADEEVKPKADQAWAGEGEFVPGDHCRFCKINSTCRARAKANLELTKKEFAEPAKLSHEEIGEILYDAEELERWVKDVKNYALDQAVNHEAHFPGWKVVEGRSNRRYTDKEKIAETLLENEYKEDEIYRPRDIITLTNMERLLGKKKFVDLVGDYVVKPAGRPTLAPEDDKRPAINSADSAKEDFK